MKNKYSLNSTLIIYFFSGIAGLAYQIIWVKLFSQIFGHTIYAVSTVTATFMAGLAIGSYLFGKLADRHDKPLVLYAIIEAGIGLYAVLLVLLLPTVNAMYIDLFNSFGLSFSAFSFTRLVFSFILLIIPASLIGGTFPVIARYYIRTTDFIKNGTGLLYGINTAGAVLGIFAVSFYLIESVGIRSAVYLTAGLNLLLSLSAFVLQGSDKPGSVSDSRDTDNPVTENFIIYVYALFGFAGLGLEVLWTRELTIVFFSSTYSFAIVLAVYLTGLTTGSLVFSRINLKIKQNEVLFLVITIILFVATFLSLPALRILPQELFIENVAAGKMTWQKELGTNFLVSFFVLFLPTFFMGAAFPVVCTLYAKSTQNIGIDLGKIYAWNTTGAVAGSLVAGFILIPLLGVAKSVGIIAVLYGLIAILIIHKYRITKSAWILTVALAAAGIFLYLAVSIPGQFRPLPSSMSLVYADESPSAEIKVLKHKDNEISLYINEKQQGGTQIEQTERWAGEIPLLFHSKPDSVILIGLGTGVTLDGLASGNTKSVTCVELIGSLADASRYFAEINNNVLSNPKVSLVEADGINYLSTVNAKWDIIVSDIVQPDDEGAAGLYSSEFYSICKSRLNDDGYFAQWLILDQVCDHELEIIFSTFKNVFPEMQVYFGQENNLYLKILMIGPARTLKIDPEMLTRNLENYKNAFTLAGRTDPLSFLSNFIISGDQIANDIPLNTMDQPLLEYSSPRNKWKLNKGIMNIDKLIKMRVPLYQSLPEFEPFREKADLYFSSRTLLLNGRLYELTGQYEQAQQNYLRAALSGVDTVNISHHLSVLAWKRVQKNQMDEAVQTYKMSLAVNHANSISSKGLADLLFKLNRISEAREFYKYTVKVDSSNFSAYNELGDIFTAEKDFDSALYSYAMSLSIYDYQPVIHFIVGQLYYNHKNDLNSALIHFERSLELHSRHRYSAESRAMIEKIKNALGHS